MANKHPCGYFFPSHKWTGWSKPIKQTRNKGKQQRRCKRCGIVKVRNAKAPFLHMHRWKLDSKKYDEKHPAALRCTVPGCKKTKSTIRGRK